MDNLEVASPGAPTPARSGRILRAREAARAWYLRYQHLGPAAFFIGGFLFDIVSLGRIDSGWNIAQQGLYLLFIASAISLETLERAGALSLSPRMRRAWDYHEFAVHFLLGSLLSVYTLFFFKSASNLTGYAFMLALAGLLVANEFSGVQKLGKALRFTLLGLCSISFFLFTIPVLVGTMGDWVFLGSLVVSLGLLVGVQKLVAQRHPLPGVLRRQVLVPVLSVHGVFALLYFLRAIPPVPLSVTYMGVFHKVVKQDGRYRLHYTRPWWKFWQSGDQSFAHRDGDAVYGFASIFSPTGFTEKIAVRWLKREDGRGWTTQDVIPVAIVGGREEGFRAYTYKKSVSPGRWRVQVETQDGREMGRLGFTVFRDTSTDAPDVRTLIR